MQKGKEKTKMLCVTVRGKVNILEDDGVDSGFWEFGNTEECFSVNSSDLNFVFIELFDCPVRHGY